MSRSSSRAGGQPCPGTAGQPPPLLPCLCSGDSECLPPAQRWGTEICPGRGLLAASQFLFSAQEVALSHVVCGADVCGR